MLYIFSDVEDDEITEDVLENGTAGDVDEDVNKSQSEPADDVADEVDEAEITAANQYNEPPEEMFEDTSKDIRYRFEYR